MRAHSQFTLEQLMGDLNLNPTEKELFQHEVECYAGSYPIQAMTSIVGEDRPYFLTIDGTFKLLEYEQLDEARKSSKEARLFAIVAILFSSITGYIQIYLSICASK